MRDRPLHHLVDCLRRAVAPGGDTLTDADLLGRFADDRDGAAFESLVWRHGPIVYGVCRRVLGHTQDAEDAFQATWLILARKAGAVRRRAAIGPWLYQVARRVALRAQARVVTLPLPVELVAAPCADEPERCDLRQVLTDEIGRLPARYRTAMVLRYLEGRTTAEAAAALGCPPGTVVSRLAWARRRLKSRLAARGLGLATALAAVDVGDAVGAVPARWVVAAAGAAGAFAAGSRSGRPAALAMEVLRSMLFSKLRVGAVVVLGAMATGVGLLLAGPMPGQPDVPNTAPAPVEVTVIRPIRKTVEQAIDFTGRIMASATVEVRPRVTGQIEKVAFRPGSTVKKGDRLITLDARAFQADVRKAEAEFLRADARRKNADESLTRGEKLISRGGVSETELSQFKATSDEARAGQLAAKAALERAQLDLDATNITAPIDGQTGRLLLDVGNLAGPTTSLVTIVATDPVCAAFNIDERSYQRLRPALQKGAVTVLMGLSGQDAPTWRGKVDFVDNQADARTGTIQARATFANADGAILPGLFAHVRVIVGESKVEWLVPAAAVRMDGDRASVLVVGTANTVERRAVTLGTLVGESRNVTVGLAADDRVIVCDPDHVKPGQIVKTTELKKDKPPAEPQPPAP
jgi:multidrug efflux system membrane fusion protein